MRRVGLIGPADRPELVRLAIRLEERGCEAVFLDTRTSPEIRLSDTGKAACGVDLTDVEAFYVVDLGLPSPQIWRDDGVMDVQASAEALAASRRVLAVWNSLLDRLTARCMVINPPRTHDLHALKPWEMAVYEGKGLPYPETVSTSDPQALLDRASEPEGDWIRKGMAGGYTYTEAFVFPSSLEEAQRLLRSGPLMVQRRIEGDNVRAFVLNGEVIGSAEIVSCEADETDSRRGDKRIRPIELSPEATRDATAAVACWGMPFSAVDLMVDARSGRHFILECNSAPFFVNFEKLSGLPISSKLADALAGRSGASGSSAFSGTRGESA